MLQGALVKFDKPVFLPKNLLQKWLDSVYSYARNASLKLNMDCP